MIYLLHQENAVNVDFKLATYNEPTENEEQEFLLIKNRNRSAYFITKSNFVYNVHSKTIYDAISYNTYREVRHETILLGNGFKFNDIEPEPFIRFEFNTTGCYNSKYAYIGKYTFSELGIPGLVFSGLYYDLPHYKQRADALKNYDLNIIESYINYLMDEQKKIRSTEINLNLPKEYKRRKRKIFS